MHKEQNIEVKNAGPMGKTSGYDRIMLAFIIVGAIVFATGLFVEAERTWYNYLIDFFFFTCLALGGLLFTAVQHGTSASWSVSVRRIAEGMTSFLPVAFVLLIILFIGIPKLYQWSDFQPGSYFTYTKKVYLTSIWFIVREVFFFALWILLAWLIVKNSLKQDKTQQPGITRTNKKLSIFFVIVFAYTFTFSSMDLLMSLEEHFYSTMFGVYCFAGLFLSGMAALATIVLSLRKLGYLENAVQKKHLHDLGTWLMAFSVFMVYIGFSQYMLIWYADLPHEIGYMVTRSKHGWQFLFVLLPLLKWIIPFVVLMPDKFRSSPKVLFSVAVGILIGQWLDIYWMVVPSFSESFRMISWIEIGIFLGFFGIFSLTLKRFYQKYPLLASGDPSLDTCLKGRYLHV
jgi:hypothetical protein